MAAIDIGYGASYYNDHIFSNCVFFDTSNPANATGVLTSFEVWIWGSSYALDFRIGTVYQPIANKVQGRDSEYIGTVATGSKQTFSGKNCDVVSGDFLGCYGTNGAPCSYYYSGDPTVWVNRFDTNGDNFGAGPFSPLPHSAGYRINIYATGTTLNPVTLTTQAATAITTTGLTGNGTITYVDPLKNATQRGFCYMPGTSGDPTTANSTAFDSGSFVAGAYTKNIAGLTPGTAYRVRAYASHSLGTYYGTTVQGTTLTATQWDTVL